MQLSLSVKLTLTFIALLVIPLISGFFAYSAIAQDRQIRREMNEQIEMELRLERVTADFHQVVLSLHDHLDTASQENIRQYQNSRRKLDRDYKAAYDVLHGDDKQTLTKIKKHLSSMDVLDNQIFAIENPKENTRTFALVAAFDDSAVRAEQVTSQISSTINGILEETLIRSNAVYERLRTRLIIAFLFLILGPLIFWIAGRNISVPMYRLVSEADRLSGGDWDKEVPQEPGLEVGALRDTLEKMRVSLVDYRSEVTNYRTTLENEVNLLQAALLPHEIPEVEGLEIATFYSSATKGLSIGGDFYDFIPLQNKKWGLVIGDVCGRGVDAAALTALTRFSLRSFALEDPAPARVFERLNKALIPQAPPGKFITIWYGAWDPVGRVITFSNGGHPYPILVRSASAEVRPITGSDLAVGISESAAYESREFNFEPADMLILYTDGLIEARSKSGEFLGEERLVKLIEGLKDKDAETVAQSIGSFCIDWVSGDLRDDVAIVVLKAHNA